MVSVVSPRLLIFEGQSSECDGGEFRAANWGLQLSILRGVIVTRPVCGFPSSSPEAGDMSRCLMVRVRCGRGPCLEQGQGQADDGVTRRGREREARHHYY